MAKSSPTRLSGPSAFGKYPLRHYVPLWILAVVNFVLIMVYVVGGYQRYLGDDRQFNDTTVHGDLTVDGKLLQYERRVVPWSADGTLRADQSGSVISISDLDTAITLPPARAGLTYTFVCEGVMDGATVTCAAGDAFFGNFKVTSTTDDKTSSDQIVTAAAATTTVANSNVMTLDGDANTSGGNAGDTIEIVATNSTLWKVTAVLVTTGVAPGAIAILA